MTLATNGDFDQTLELSAELMTAAASSTLGIRSDPADLPAGLGATGSVSAIGELDQIWFRTRPKPWATDSGFGNLTRNTSDVITLALRLDVHIELETLQITVNNTAQTVDITTDSKYDPIRSIDFPAFVEVTDHVEVQTLDVTIDRERTPADDIDEVRAERVAPRRVRVPCVVIDFNTKAALFGSDWPRVDVRIKRSDLQKNPAVMAMMAAAVVNAGGSGAAGDAALTGLLTTLTTNIPLEITKFLQSMSTWQLELPADRGKTLLYVSPPPKATSDPPIPKALGVKTLDDRSVPPAESLFIGIDYLAKRGSTQTVTVSTLRGRGGRRDDFGVTVSNRWLLRGIIRRVLATLFARVGPPPADLAPADFVSAEFCQLKSPVRVTFGKSVVTLETLLAVVNNSSQLDILLEISKEDPPGLTAHAVLDLKLSFSVTRSLSGPSQTLLLTTTLDNPNTAIQSKRVDVDWWWYMLGFVAGPVVGTLQVGVADAVGFEDKFAVMLNDALGSFTGPSIATPFPLPVTIERPGVELNDPGAPSMPTPVGRALGLINLAGGHDLYLGMGFSTLLAKPTDALKVEFVIPDSADVGGRLDGIGGTFNEVQRVRVTGAPTGGTFTLAFMGNGTSGIAYNATNSAVVSALEALPNIDGGDVAVSGGPLPATPIDVTFQGKLAGRNTNQLTAASSLTGGTSPKVSVSTVKEGLEWRLSIDDAVALVDAGRLLTVDVPPAPVTKIVKAVSSRGVPYLRTPTDDFGENNLGNLPKRIPAAGTTL